MKFLKPRLQNINSSNYLRPAIEQNWSDKNWKYLGFRNFYPLDAGFMNFKTLYDLTAEKADFFSGPLPIAYLFFIIGIGLLMSYKKVKESKRLIVGLGFTFISLIVEVSI